MAEAWSRHGITCNAIAPGFFPMPLTAPVFADAERAARLAAQTCIGRNGQLEDLHGAAVFLALDRCPSSRFRAARAASGSTRASVAKCVSASTMQ
ncbi:MAG TPA: SDR family oxidoreductase [Falsiroseomonas sp.]|nr:SDR family oxidoreductase [Falsiroseomonas sp.]